MKLKGFSLIELLISLLILSLILTISTNFMRSSFFSNNATNKNSIDLQEFQVLSSFIRKDFQYMKPIPMIDGIGENTKIVLMLQNNPTLLEFTIYDYADEDYKELARLIYLLDETTFTRKQFASDQPYNKQDYFSFPLAENVSNLSIEAFDGERWHDYWPKSPIMERRLPKGIKLSFSQDKRVFEYLVSINNETVFKF